jgi:hypothetical protein
MGEFGFGFGWQDVGFCGGPFASPGATYNFSGINGSGTVTETITDGSETSTVTFTAESGNSSLYQITSVAEGTHSQAITPSSASPTFGFEYDTATQTTTVIETITHATSTETQTYTSGSTGSFTLSDDTVTIDTPSTSQVSYSFGTSGSITTTQSWGSHSFSNTQPLGPTTSLSGVGTSTVTETSIAGDSVTTVTFTGSSSAGYAISQTSTSFIPQGSATTALDVVPYDRAEFNFSANTVTWISANGTAGSAQSTTANSHVVFTELGAATGISGDFVGETTTFGTHSSFEIYYSSSGTGGQYMEVAHGSGAASAVSLVGLATQLAALGQLQTLVT